MLQQLLLALLIKLIEAAGPVIIEIILKWLAGLTGDQQKTIALMVSDALKSTQTKKPAQNPENSA